MDTFNLRVVFKNEQEIIIEGVEDYKIKDNILEVAKKGLHQFFNWNEVKYCRLKSLD